MQKFEPVSTHEKSFEIGFLFSRPELASSISTIDIADVNLLEWCGPHNRKCEKMRRVFIQKYFINEHFEKLAEMAQKERRITESHSIEEAKARHAFKKRRRSDQQTS